MIKKLLFVLLFCNISYTQVYINELDCDTAGTDALEFVEFKTDTPNFSLNGYVLVFFNEGTGVSYQTFDLDGITTDCYGIATLGSVGVSPAPDRNAPDNFIENGPDGLAIYQLNTAPANGKTPAQITGLGGILVDALIYETNDATPATGLMAALGETISYDEYISASSTSVVNSIQRKSDGTYETKTPTPDVPNDGSGAFNYLRTTLSPTGDQTEGIPFNIVLTFDSNLTVDKNINLTLANGTFTTADYTGSLSVTILAGSRTVSIPITLVDDATNEGDETMKIVISDLGSCSQIIFNNNIEVRIHDNDYIVQPWGTPIAPTYGLCPSTVPAGYYDSLEGKSGTQLKQAIQDIIANPAVVRYQTYGDVWGMLAEADTDPKNDGNVWLMYVEHPSSKLNQQTGTSGAIGFWNREHIYCQSRGDYDNNGANPLDTSVNGKDVYTLTSGANDIYAGGSDGHHIRAEDSPENSSRNNKNYGIDLSGTDDYNGPSGTAGSWRGDVARAVFYMCVRYNGLNVINGFPSETPTGYIGDLTTLLSWNKLDKSDDFEMNRNNIIYNWQRNRNPFIDYPLLVDYVFGDKVGQVWNASLATNDYNELDVVMYPNPSNGSIYIAGLKQEARIVVHSITGQKVFESNYSVDSRLDLNLSSGVYLFKITEGNASTTKKLVIR